MVIFLILYSENEKRKMIMDYYLNPRNRLDSFENDNYKNTYLHSSSCVDEITLYFNEDKSDFKFIAQGCAIFISSTEIFIEEIKNKGFSNKDKLIACFKRLVNKEQLNDEERKYLSKLNIYENVSTHLNRKECALLIANIFSQI